MAGASLSDFDAFWSAYPRRVGKFAALKAFAKARTVATAEEILAGVEQYRQHLPEDVQFVAHPSTWLNQGRWLDSYDALPPKVQGRHVPSAADTSAYLRNLRSVK